MGADTNNNRMFRLHDGATAAPGWIESKVISPKDVQGIKDPDGAKASKEITSIPSPFARFNIVKTAFEQVTIAARSDINNLDGRTIYHKLVSDALDIGQIFFEYDKFKSNIEIIKWDKSQLDNLNQSAGQTCLADSLSMFLEQDAAAFNFDNLDGIYMLNYIGADRPYPLNIIGGTSLALCLWLRPMIGLGFPSILLLVMIMLLTRITSPYMKGISIIFVSYGR